MLEKIIKDYFSFSRKERIAVSILVILMVIILLLPKLIPEPDGNTKKAGQDNFTIRLDQLPALKKERQSGSEENRGMADPDEDHGYGNRSAEDMKQSLKRESFYFDPNTISGEDWKRLGVQDRTIVTIHKYLSKGGRFKNREDIKKIYGLRAGDVERLSPYVKIEHAYTESKQEQYEKGVYNNALPENLTRSKPRILLPILDINKADTAEFIALPGIGNKLAARIVLFRQKLGGFYTIEQLSEVYGLPDSTFQKIRPGLTITNPQLSLMNINTIEVDELKQHPYIKWNLANIIVGYRRQHGNYKSLDDLRNIEVITDELYKKVSPYFKIE